MANTTRWIGGCALAIVLGTGCVSDESYRRLLDRDHDLQKRLKTLEAENDLLKRQADMLKLLHSRAEADAGREREARAAAQAALERLEERTRIALEELAASAPKGEIEFDPESGKIRILETVLFETGRSELKPRAEATLREVARILKRETDRGLMVRVEGHTDDQPIVRNLDAYPSNWHLSGARALNVLFFLGQEGLPSDRLCFTGYGEFQPREANAPGHKGSALNRRVEIAVVDAGKGGGR